MSQNLSEPDARLLTTHIVTAIRKRQVNVSQFGVFLEHEGFCFMATINGRTGWAYTGQGHVQYDDVARALIADCTQPRDIPLLGTPSLLGTRKDS